MRRATRTPRNFCAAAALGALVVAPLIAAIAPRAAHAEEPARLVVNRQASAVAIGAMAGALVASESMKSAFAPESCRVCGSNAFDDGVRDALRWSNTETAARVSDTLDYGVVPLLGAGLLLSTHVDGGPLVNDAFLDDLLIVGEATFAAGLLVQSTKFVTGRQRPFVRALAPGDTGYARDTDDDNLSFYSGHTSMTVALGTSVATLASLRGHRSAPWLWASGIVAGLATGYLRIAADRHYATDVLAGAAVGAAIGAFVPRLHLARGEENASAPAIALTPRELTLTWSL
jgi:membrane-associated phospholipid phosphatase